MLTLQEDIISLFGQCSSIIYPIAIYQPLLIQLHQEQEEKITRIIDQALSKAKLETLQSQLQLIQSGWLVLKDRIRQITQGNEASTNALTALAHKIMKIAHQTNKEIFIFLTPYKELLHKQYTSAITQLLSEHGIGSAQHFIEQIVSEESRAEMNSSLPTLIYEKLGLEAVIQFLKEQEPKAKSTLTLLFIKNLLETGIEENDQAALTIIKSHLSCNPVHSITIAHLATSTVERSPELAMRIAALIPSRETAIEWFTDSEIFSFLVDTLEEEDVETVQSEIALALACCSDSIHSAKEIVSYALENLITPALDLQTRRTFICLIPDEAIRQAAEAELQVTSINNETNEYE
ncbi:MAG: hypothetical protein JWO53_692 [Chlamydiia bacterium]|nr:hypothetical protein [Chlamydiia bacterium]